MHQFAVLTLLAACFCMGCDAPPAGNADESKEPPLEFTVNVGDKSISITEGETTRIDGTFTNPTISVVPRPFRVFRCQGVSFRYPRAFTFEADLADSDAKNWTLSGNDVKVMYFVVKSRMSTGDFADEMIEQFNRKNCRVIDANATITLAGQTLSGTTIQIRIGTHELLQDIYQVPSHGGGTRLLVVQDNLDEAGNRSTEGQEMRKELEASFTIDH